MINIFENIYTQMAGIQDNPQLSWRFVVRFYVASASGETYDYNCIKIDLPKMEIKFKTLYSYGGEKSFPIYRAKSGDSTLEFYMNSKYDKFVYDMTNVTFTNSTKISKIEIYPLPRGIEVDTNQQKNFKNMTPDTKYNILENTFFENREYYKYVLENPVITSLDLGTFSYEDESIMKVTMTVHYDNWEYKQNNTKILSS